MTNRLKGLPNVPFAPIAALLFGGVASILVFATPQWLFERGVVASGLPALVSAAQPPLGDTARLLSAGVVGLIVALVLWPVFALLVRGARRGRKRSGPKARGSRISPVAVPRTADGEASRAPIFAQRDLGAPFMSPAAVASGEELMLDAGLHAEAPRKRQFGPAAAAPAAPPRIDYGDAASEFADPYVAAPLLRERPPMAAESTLSSILAPPAMPVAPPVAAPVVEPVVAPIAAVSFEPAMPPMAAPIAPMPVAPPPVAPSVMAAVVPPAPAPAAAPIFAPQPVARRAPDGSESIAELMTRLETALVRRAG